MKINHVHFYFSFKKDGPVKRRTKCEKALIFFLVIFILVVIALVVVVLVQKNKIDDDKSVKNDVTATKEPGKLHLPYIILKMSFDKYCFVIFLLRDDTTKLQINKHIITIVLLNQTLVFYIHYKQKLMIYIKV
jgi:hypothetical protein